MSTQDTGGPAFPCETLGVDDIGEYRKPYEGMNLRDYFAGQALIACRNQINEEWLAKRAYKIADAMLQARSQ